MAEQAACIMRCNGMIVNVQKQQALAFEVKPVMIKQTLHSTVCKLSLLMHALVQSCKATLDMNAAAWGHVF